MKNSSQQNYLKMKKFFTILYLLILSALPSLAQTATDQKADSAYNAGNYAEAAQLYLETIKSEGSSDKLYYNLGNSYYRLGQTANAIIAYERALRLEPGNDNARSNLEFVNSKLIDKKGYEGSFISRTFNDATLIMSTDSWAWTALFLFLLLIAGVAIYIFATNITARKAGFFGSGIIAILWIICMIFAFNGKRLMQAKNVAIVTAKSTILSTAPRQPQNRAEEAMLLHEGARVVLLDSIESPIDSVKTTWYDAQFDNEHRAWINGNDIEAI